MRRPAVVTLLLATLALVLAACGDDDSSTSEAPTVGSGQAEAPAGGSQKPQVSVPEGEPPKKLVIEDLDSGNGKAAASGDRVTVHYVGVLFEDGEQFDASWDRGRPFPFRLGAGEVIPGWDQGVEGMRVGGRRQLVIPPQLGYGRTGFPPAIPPNETLVFVVDLIKVE